MDKKTKFDKSYLAMASVWAENSYCTRRKVGAILVKDRMIISDGYNGTPSGFENECEDANGVTKPYVLHAEANAITKVAKSGNSSEGAPSDEFVFRANGGRGLRYSTPLIDNIGILSTGKEIHGELLSHPLEESWTFGGNATWYIGGSSSTYLSLDYFGTRFTEQMLVDYDASSIRLYTLSSIADGSSRTDNLQLDFNIEPFKGFTATLTGRLTDARQTLLGQSGDIKPMTSRYKGVLNLQYATNLNKWIFDFTASVNGPCRVWDFMKSLDPIYADGFTPVYPLLYAQVTKRFKGFDIYVGGENLTGYMQPNPIINASSPFSSGFDASCIWGPLMGAKIYGGIRLTIWKTE